MTVDPDDVGLRVHPVDRLVDVLGGLEEAGHLVDPVDEDERAHLGELRRDRVDEMQREPGEGGNRSGDVGDHDDLGLGRTRISELGFGGDTAVGE